MWSTPPYGLRFALTLAAVCILAASAVANTLLHDAARANDVERLEALVARRGVDPTDVYHATPLHVAAGAGSLEAVAVLLDLGADVSAVDAEHRTPLHYAARGGHTEVVALLLERGAREIGRAHV